MELADALSRNIKENFIIKEVSTNKEQKVMAIHRDNCHRKNIESKCKAAGISLSKMELCKILQNCQTCAAVDKKFIKSAEFVMTESVGKLLGIDIMDIDKKHKVVLAIDYFSRKLWGKCFKTKEAKNVLGFIKGVYNE